jgi:hypothetical protein
VMDREVQSTARPSLGGAESEKGMLHMPMERKGGRMSVQFERGKHREGEHSTGRWWKAEMCAVRSTCLRGGVGAMRRSY